MSDVLTERASLRQLMGQRSIVIGAGFFTSGVAGLVACVFWLSSLSASRPSTVQTVAAAPIKRAEEQRAPMSAAAAAPEQNPDVPKLSGPVVEQPKAPSPEQAHIQTQAATSENDVPAAGNVSEPAASLEPMPTTVTAAQDINAVAPMVGMAEPPPPVTLKKAYRLQLGSVRTLESAQQEWDRLEAQNGDVLTNLGYVAARVDLGARGIFYRIQAGPVADAAAADRTCKELKRRGVGCIIIKP